MDLQMVSLPGQIMAINAQIASAGSGSTANAHIRRYLLAALSDKRQTLTEILGPGTGAPDERSNS
jgi:hypothetical protein